MKFLKLLERNLPATVEEDSIIFTEKGNIYVNKKDGTLIAAGGTGGGSGGGGTTEVIPVVWASRFAQRPKHETYGNHVVVRQSDGVCLYLFPTESSLYYNYETGNVSTTPEHPGWSSYWWKNGTWVFRSNSTDVLSIKPSICQGGYIRAWGNILEPTCDIIDYISKTVWMKKFQLYRKEEDWLSAFPKVPNIAGYDESVIFRATDGIRLYLLPTGTTLKFVGSVVETNNISGWKSYWYKNGSWVFRSENTLYLSMPASLLEGGSVQKGVNVLEPTLDIIDSNKAVWMNAFIWWDNDITYEGGATGGTSAGGKLEVVDTLPETPSNDDNYLLAVPNKPPKLVAYIGEQWWQAKMTPFVDETNIMLTLSTGCAKVVNKDILRPTTAMSFSAVVRPTYESTYGYVVGSGAETSSVKRGICLIVAANGTMYAGVKTADKKAVTGYFTITKEAKMHVVVTFDLNTLNVYINGVLVKSQAASTNSDTNDSAEVYAAHIGAPSSGQDNRFKGSIEHFATYSKALTAEEVQTLYASSPSSIQSVQYYWPCNDGGEILTDVITGQEATLLDGYSWTLKA